MNFTFCTHINSINQKKSPQLLFAKFLMGFSSDWCY